MDFTQGLITNYQDYAVHDGFGLRVLVFLKGCPLRCEWCQNPETLRYNYDLMYHDKLCKGCNKCSTVCSAGAIKNDKIERVDRSKCNYCMECAQICPTGALAQVGRWATVDEVVKTMLEYKPFFDGSQNGGITISGGEPTFQPKFTFAILKECKRTQIHTAMETCGYTDYPVIAEMAKYLDLLLCDVKHMDELSHQRATGASNKKILKNLTLLRKNFPQMEIVIRTPLIPGFNDDEHNIEETGIFLSSIGIDKWDLLPFNTLAIAKYKALGKEWQYKNAQIQEKEYLNKLKKLAELHVPDVTVGGLR